MWNGEVMLGSKSDMDDIVNVVDKIIITWRSSNYEIRNCTSTSIITEQTKIESIWTIAENL